MMNQRNQKMRVKGFTLVEMVVVVAIIGILLGILTPAMMSYVRKSRLSEANTDAKLVYNAAQTSVQRYLVSERPLAAADRVFTGKVCYIAYQANGHTIQGAAGNAGFVAGSTLSAYADLEANQQTAFTNVVNHVNNTVSGAREVQWAVCVDNCIVKASVSASMPNSRYIGSYTSSPDATKRNQSDVNSGTYQTRYLDVLKGAVTQYGNS